MGIIMNARAFRAVRDKVINSPAPEVKLIQQKLKKKFKKILKSWRHYTMESDIAFPYRLKYRPRWSSHLPAWRDLAQCRTESFLLLFLAQQLCIKDT